MTSSLNPSSSDMLFQRFFVSCRAEDRCTGCPPSGLLREWAQRDWSTHYYSAESEIEVAYARLLVSPCILYFALRREISVGNYGAALLLGGKKAKQARCTSLVALEKARLMWFSEEFQQALRLLEGLSSSLALPVRFRASNLEAACAIEVWALSKLGLLSSGQVSPSEERLAGLAISMAELELNAARSGDFECANWATLDRLSIMVALAREPQKVAQEAKFQLRSIIRNGRPHAFRKLALVLAARGLVDEAIELAFEGRRLAKAYFPGNMILLKLSLEAMLYSDLARNPKVMNKIALSIRYELLDFLARQGPLRGTPFYSRAQAALSRLLGSRESEVRRLAPFSDEALREALTAISPEQMVEEIAYSLLVAEFGTAEILPREELDFDAIALSRVAGENLKFAVQVKSKAATLRKNELPHIESIRAAKCHGYVYVGIRDLHRTAYGELSRRCGEAGLLLYVWTGKKLLDLIRHHPEVCDILLVDGDVDGATLEEAWPSR